MPRTPVLNLHGHRRTARVNCRMTPEHLKLLHSMMPGATTTDCIRYLLDKVAYIETLASMKSMKASCNGDIVDATVRALTFFDMVFQLTKDDPARLDTMLAAVKANGAKPAAPT